MNKSKTVQVKRSVSLARDTLMVFVVLLLAFSITSGGIMSVALADAGEDSSSLTPNVDEEDNDEAGEALQDNSTENTSTSMAEANTTSTTSSAESTESDGFGLGDAIFLIIIIPIIILILIIAAIVAIFRYFGGIGKLFGGKVLDKLDD